MCDINSMRGGMPWPQTGLTQYHTQLELPDKGRAIKGLVVFNNWYLAKQSGPRLDSTVP